MAITPIGMKPKEEGSAWDKISQVMGFASTALNIGTDIKKFTDGGSEVPASDPEVPASDPVVDDPLEGNPLYRRFKAGQRLA